jgi:hypothetical protein
MRNKYDYFVNEEKMTRKDFMKELKSCCQKVIRTDVIAGWCGVDLMGFDEKVFRRNMRDIEKGIAVMFPEYNKTFRRKVMVKGE